MDAHKNKLKSFAETAKNKIMGHSSQSQTLPASTPQGADNTDNLVTTIMNMLDMDKAEQIVQIDLRGKTAIADNMIIASGRSQRHISALADHLMRTLKQLGIKKTRIEGIPHCDWVLVDAGDIIIHIFRAEVRAFYNLEKMWMMDAPSS